MVVHSLDGFHTLGTLSFPRSQYCSLSGTFLVWISFTLYIFSAEPTGLKILKPEFYAVCYLGSIDNPLVKPSGRASLVPSLCPRRVGHKFETKRSIFLS